jgi:hypothetical protein
MVAGMTPKQLELARHRQRKYLLDQNYVEQPDGWWRGRNDWAMPLTDEVDTGKFALDDGQPFQDLMIRFRNSCLQ